MIVLGLDVSSTATGWGVVHVHPRSFEHVASGTIRPKSPTFVGRLAILQSRIGALAVNHQIDEVAVEDVFCGKNLRGSLRLAQARGAATSALESYHVKDYAPATIKKCVGGHGQASKDQVRHMVKQLLGHWPKSRDESDALATAITHGMHVGG